jgi:hypothetical protein
MSGSAWTAGQHLIQSAKLQSGKFNHWPPNEAKGTLVLPAPLWHAPSPCNSGAVLPWSLVSVTYMPCPRCNMCSAEVLPLLLRGWLHLMLPLATRQHRPTGARQ